ncbi:MAG TPA: TRAP transporter substrate-binding protein [Candidatus Sumerlaeota bacterium]|nr:TRAP transporter substrate-binding protein [Candidatus Sumerlaeota bacterium]
MTRSRFLVLSLTIFLALGAAATLSAQEKEVQPITLTYANFPPASTFPCVQMERWKEEVEKRTGGKVAIQTFPGGTLLGAPNMFDGVVTGMADIGNMAMSYQPGRFPVSEVVDLPLGFPSAKVASLTLYDLIMEKYKPKEFEQVKVLTLFTCPPSNFMTSKPVKTLADLKGMELRVAGTGTEIVKRLGGTPVAMPQSDTPDAIQKGVIKGMVSSMEILKDFNFAAYCPYATVQNMHVVTFAVIMNKDKWNALPDDVKKVMDELSRDQAIWTGTYVDDHIKEALEWSKENHKLQIFEFPAEDKAKIPELFAPIIEDYLKRATAAGLPAADILKDARALMEKYAQEYK